VMKTYFKSILRSVKSNIARFVSIIVIMILGIAFVAGLGTLSPTIKDSFSAEMNKNRFYDIDVKCKLATGFTQEAVDTLTAMDEVDGSGCGSMHCGNGRIFCISAGTIS